MKDVDLRGQRVLVVGLGQSGLAAVRVLASRGAQVVVNDARAEAALGERVAQARAAGAVDAVLGGHDPALFTSVDRIVLSPGVPPMPALQAADAAGVPVASEVELASWFVEAPVLAVTGTNGKSTVTTLLGEMCRRTGRPTFVGGNLGTPLVDVVGSEAARPDGYVVVELSSFQLERVDQFRAHVAVLLNITEDHLDRYDRFEDYVAAKGRIFEGQSTGDAAVVPAGDTLCNELAAAGRAPIHGFGEPDGEVRIRGERIVNGRSSLAVSLAELRIRGRHNLQNACAAALAARLADVEVETIHDVLRTFPGLPHRMQHVADVGGVVFYDDSKATNVGAAVAALDGLDDVAGRVVLVAGGKDKGGSYRPLRESLARRARGVVLIGEAAPRIEAALLGSGYPVVRASTMQEAVAQAHALAEPRDAVVLAPACASFDMFGSFEERGRAFQGAVRALGEETA